MTLPRIRYQMLEIAIEQPEGKLETPPLTPMLPALLTTGSRELATRVP